MTVSTTQIRVSYTGDGTSVNFSIPFLFYATTDLLVLLGNSVQSNGYTVTGAGTGSGTATFSSPPAVGVAVQIVLNVPLTQQVNLVDGTAFPSATINQENDRAIQASLRLNDLISRSIRAPDGDTSPNMLLPVKSNRISMSLMTDVNGDITVGVPSTQTMTQSLIGQLLYPRTNAETSAGVTPTNFAYAPGWATRFGVDTSGATDSTAALQNALNAAAKGAWFSSTGGATVTIPSGALLKILGNLTIPPNVTLKGPQSGVGTGTADSKSCNYAAMGGSIALASTATITLQAGACLDGILIYRSGMSFPATDSSAFAGTAITAGGDDWRVQNCMILGFAQAISSDGYQRGKVFYNAMDNLAGVYVNNSQDKMHVSFNHFWPYAVFRAGVTAAQMQRSGNACSINNSNDWGDFSCNLAYGYNADFLINTCNSITLSQCGGDNTANAFGTGFSVQGICYDIKFDTCQAAANIQNFAFFHTNGATRCSCEMDGCMAWGASTHGVLVFSTATGDVQIRGGGVRNCPNGISVQNATSVVDIDLVRFDSDDTVPINVTVSTSNVRIGNSNDFGAFAGAALGTPANVILPTIASASAITLPNSGSAFNLSGNFVGLGTINNGWAGREVTFFITGSPTINSSTGSFGAVRLSGGSNFAATAGAVLKIAHNGVQWYASSQVP